MINPHEMPINDETRNEAHITSTGVRLHWHKNRNGKQVTIVHFLMIHNEQRRNFKDLKKREE